MTDPARVDRLRGLLGEARELTGTAAYLRATDAIELARLLAAEDPAVEPELASALELAANGLTGGYGTAQQATALIDEALEIRRRHADDDGIALARALFMRSFIAEDSGLDVYDGLDILRLPGHAPGDVAAALLLLLPDRGREVLGGSQVTALARLHRLLRDRTHRGADALAYDLVIRAARESGADADVGVVAGLGGRDSLDHAIALQRELVARAPTEARHKALAGLLLRQVEELREQGWHERAVEPAREALTVSARGSLPQDRAIAAYILCDCLCDLRRGDEALAVADDIVRSERAAADGTPEREAALALAICCRAPALSTLGRHGEAIAAAKQTWRILRRLARKDRRFGGHAIEALKAVAAAYEQAGKPSRASFFRLRVELLEEQ